MLAAQVKERNGRRVLNNNKIHGTNRSDLLDLTRSYVIGKISSVHLEKCKYHNVVL